MFDDNKVKFNSVLTLIRQHDHHVVNNAPAKTLLQRRPPAQFQSLSILARGINIYA